MNIFFGKISQEIDVNQINEGYYSSDQGSTWFGELQLGDYVYVIGGNKIQFWQAREWGIKNGRESLLFTILSSDLGINVSQLIALKFLKITKSLAVLTSRSARNKAFFKIDSIKDVSINDLSNSNYYKNESLYRSIKITSNAGVISDSEDIQLVYENSKLHLVDNNFIEESIKNEFVDNLDKKGKGARMKDTVLENISKAVLNMPSTITHKQIGFRSFYDTFFCDYKEKDITAPNDTNYWIFQGSPKIYDAVAAVKANAVHTWTVSAHRDKIKPGDKFILWLTGANAGCYALGRVDSEVGQMKEEDVEMTYYLAPQDSIEAYRVKISIEHQFVDHPILWDMVKDEEAFADFKGSNQGTNFTATKEQYDTFLAYVTSASSSAYAKVKKVLDPKKVQSFLTILRHYVQKHAIQPNDERVSFNVWEKDNRLVFLIGKRYALNIQLRHKQTKISFVAKEILTEDFGSFTNQKGEVEAYWNSIEVIEDYQEAIEEGFDIELGRNNKCSYRKYTNQDFINDVYQLKPNAMATESPTPSFPLNQILYGPPGTGKTYHTVLEAAKIVTGNLDIKYDKALDVFKDSLDNQIEFITFHQNYSYEDFIQGLRPDTENGSALTFEKKDGVFKRIADRALKNYIASENPTSVKKEFEVVFHELITPLNEGDVTEIEIKMKKSSFFITEVGEKSIDFRKNIGESVHTLSINTLRKMYDKGVNDIILGGLQPYYNPILELLLEKGKSQVTSVARQNYVIIIDEINRANISRVFGELITLIEEDKRSHGAIPMRVTLPSGDSFIVPSNLHIIGTMNTADKSIALLDIALRRRFEFVPMYPQYAIEGQVVHDAEILRKINAAIVSRKNHDFTIGHAYFMGTSYSLEKTINHKVIPLLLEYFMNSEKEVTDILKEAGIAIGDWPLRMIPS